VFHRWKKSSSDTCDGSTTPMSENPRLIPKGSPLILRLSMIVGFLAVILLIVVTKRSWLFFYPAVAAETDTFPGWCNADIIDAGPYRR